MTNTIEDQLIKRLKAGCRVAFLTGAGISVSAGIPDFRSPGGMYDTLRPDLLTCTREQQRILALEPTFAVSLPLFEQNQFCYLEVRQSLLTTTQFPNTNNRFSYEDHSFSEFKSKSGKQPLDTGSSNYVRIRES